MESKRAPTDAKGRKLKRYEVLERKKAIDEVVKAASLIKDHLAFYQPFRKYDRNATVGYVIFHLRAADAEDLWAGLSLYLESAFGDHLSSSMKCYIQRLLKDNMEGPYGQEWPMEEKIKCREMIASEARYIFVREDPRANTPQTSLPNSGQFLRIPWSGDGDCPVGFVHYRFIVEEDIPVIYVYELQLEPHVQGKGLGKFLMELIELIGCKNQMGAAVLTVQRANVSAMNFYMHKLRYVISSISPSRVDPLVGAELSYEILCKSFNQEAKTKLEENKITLE